MVRKGSQSKLGAQLKKQEARRHWHSARATQSLASRSPWASSRGSGSAAPQTPPAAPRDTAEEAPQAAAQLPAELLAATAAAAMGTPQPPSTPPAGGRRDSWLEQGMSVVRRPSDVGFSC